MKERVPAEVQQELRRLLAQALVNDYLDAQKAVKPNHGEHPPPDDSPKTGSK